MQIIESEKNFLSSKKTLSIYIPTYNRDRCLFELLGALSRELRGCERNSIEVVVSNNCSSDATDQTLNLACGLSVIDRVILNSTNVGGAKNILAFDSVCSGDFVWILCDDDLPAVGSISRILEIIRQVGEQVSVIYTNRRVELMSGKIQTPKVIKTESDLIVDPHKLISSNKEVIGELLTASTLVLKRKNPSKVFEAEFGEGYGCSPLCAALDRLLYGRLYLSSSPLVIYREGDKPWVADWPVIWNENVFGLIVAFERHLNSGSKE